MDTDAAWAVGLFVCVIVALLAVSLFDCVTDFAATQIILRRNG